MEYKSILRELPKGSIEAFEFLVNTYERRIYCFIYNIIHNTEESEDLTQDVFIKIYKNSYKYNPKFPIEPWLFKITYNAVINYIKKNKNALKEIPIESNLYNYKSSDDDMIGFETRDMILKEINSLKPEIRMIMYLRIIEDLSFYQISEVLGITDSSAKLKFYRNKKVLIKKLINREVLIWVANIKIIWKIF